MFKHELSVCFLWYNQ